MSGMGISTIRLWAHRRNVDDIGRSQCVGIQLLSFKIRFAVARCYDDVRFGRRVGNVVANDCKIDEAKLSLVLDYAL